MKPGISNGLSSVSLSKYCRRAAADTFDVIVSDKKLKKSVCVKRKKSLVGS